MIKLWRDALIGGDLESVRRLLEAGVDSDTLDRYNQSGLMLAARHGHTEVVELLIERGAALDRTAKYGMSALMLAVLNMQAAAARLLVNAGARTDIRGSGAPGFEGKTAVELAEANGQSELAQYIREAGSTRGA